MDRTDANNYRRFERIFLRKGLQSRRSTISESYGKPALVRLAGESEIYLGVLREYPDDSTHKFNLSHFQNTGKPKIGHILSFEEVAELYVDNQI